MVASTRRCKGLPKGPNRFLAQTRSSREKAGSCATSWRTKTQRSRSAGLTTHPRPLRTKNRFSRSGPSARASASEQTPRPACCRARASRSDPNTSTGWEM